MICISADTASEKLALALIVDEKVFTYSREVGKSGHSALLVPCIKELLKANGVTPDMLDAVAVNVGPGSFTGIRIGVSAMTALAFATGARKIAFTSFDVIAYDRGQTLAAVDAGHGNAYLAKCENGVVLEKIFITAEQSELLRGACFEPAGDYASTMAKVVLKKATAGDYVGVLEPMYMRRSQAEREKDDV